MQKRTSPSGAASPQNGSSRDLAVAAIKEALEMIGEADQEFDRPRIKPTEKYASSDTRLSRLAERWQRTTIAPGVLVGLLVLVCISVAVLAWPSNGGKAAPESIVTSSVPSKKKAELPNPASNSSRVATATQAEPQHPAPQNALGAPAVAPLPPELAHQIQEMARALANLEQGISQLKTERSQTASESALAELLKQTRELARHSTELNENLKATQAEIAHEISDLADQLKANRNLMMALAGQLNENQEQIARLLASEQKPRARLSPPSPVATAVPTAPVATVVRRAAPKPPTATAGTQAREPAHVQTGQ